MNIDQIRRLCGMRNVKKNKNTIRNELNHTNKRTTLPQYIENQISETAQQQHNA